MLGRRKYSHNRETEWEIERKENTDFERLEQSTANKMKTILLCQLYVKMKREKKNEIA